MHALGRYLQREIAVRGWSPAELARRSQLNRQNVYQLLDDDRDNLGRLPEAHTAQRLANALGVAPEVIWGKALEAMGIPIGNLAAAVGNEAGGQRDEVMKLAASGDLPDEVLLGLVRQRLDATTTGERQRDEMVELAAIKERLLVLIEKAEGSNGQQVSVHDLRDVLNPPPQQ